MRPDDGLKPEPSIRAFQKAASLPNWSTRLATDAQVEAMTALIEEGLGQGALGIGFNVGYSPPSGRKEYYELNKVAAAHNVPTFTHIRLMSVDEPLSSFEAYEEVVAVAASTGAHMHICHVNSTALRDVPQVLELIGSAQRRGVRISIEAYPYSAASTVIGAAMFRGPRWQERLDGVTTSDFEHEGRQLDDESFAKLQSSDPGAIIVYEYLRPDLQSRDQQLLDQSVLYPGGAIASDAMPWTVEGNIVSGDVWPIPEKAFAHPRSAGTFTRFLRDYVRDRRRIGLLEALRKITLIPARILELAVPQMRSKGRVQVGADADIVIFDERRFADRATFARPAQPSSGMQWVIVAGIPIIEDGRMDARLSPGKPIRRERSHELSGVARRVRSLPSRPCVVCRTVRQ